jgi:hypothetical protein
MNSGTRETRPETVLLIGGTIGILAVAGQFLTIYTDGDLSTPVGRFTAMAEVLNHLTPLLGASALLLAGSWSSDRRVRRGLVAGWLILIVVVALAGLVTLLPDARQLASGIVPVQLGRFRSQVARTLLYLVGMVVLLSYATWKYLRDGRTVGR